jgi:hypothetical protein
MQVRIALEAVSSGILDHVATDDQEAITSALRKHNPVLFKPVDPPARINTLHARLWNPKRLPLLRTERRLHKSTSQTSARLLKHSIALTPK